MADKSAIEWTDATWNPIAGCTRVSEGCRHCYAERLAARGLPGFEGLAHFVDRPDRPREARWTGAVTVREHLMDVPLRWKRPRRIFVNSMSDLFHDAVPDEVIDRIFAVMALAPQHTFQILTKRPERMRKYLEKISAHADRDRKNGLPAEWQTRLALANKPGSLPITRADVLRHLGVSCKFDYDQPTPAWPLPNVWFGESVEDQVTADVRRPYLQAIAAAGWNTFVSYEPALGLVDWTGWEFLKWFISGGESGLHARPSHPDCHRAARDFCAGHGIPYHFKQWGEWVSVSEVAGDGPHHRFPDGATVRRTGKRIAGRTLDGVEHNGMPEMRRG